MEQKRFTEEDMEACWNAAIVFAKWFFYYTGPQRIPAASPVPPTFEKWIADFKPESGCSNFMEVRK